MSEKATEDNPLIDLRNILLDIYSMREADFIALLLSPGFQYEYEGRAKGSTLSAKFMHVLRELNADGHLDHVLSFAKLVSKKVPRRRDLQEWIEKNDRPLSKGSDTATDDLKSPTIAEVASEPPRVSAGSEEGSEHHPAEGSEAASGDLKNPTFADAAPELPKPSTKVDADGTIGQRDGFRAGNILLFIVALIAPVLCAASVIVLCITPGCATSMVKRDKYPNGTPTVRRVETETPTDSNPNSLTPRIRVAHVVIGELHPLFNDFVAKQQEEFDPKKRYLVHSLFVELPESRSPIPASKLHLTSSVSNVISGLAYVASKLPNGTVAYKPIALSGQRTSECVADVPDLQAGDAVVILVCLRTKPDLETVNESTAVIIQQKGSK